MPRILTRQNAVLTDESQYATKQAQIQTEQDAQRNTKLDTANTSLTTANTNLVNLKNQQDTIIGALNNTTIGDGTLGQRTYVYAHDTAAGQGRALKCDSSGRLECSVDALEVTAETINLNTDTMEAKLQAISDGQTQNGNGTGNKPGVILDAINTNTITGNSKLDTIITNTAAASSAGTATEAKQDTQITHLSEIEGAVENLELTVGTNTATAPTRSLQIGGKYVDGTFRDIKVDNIGKVIVDSPSGSDINTRIDAISNGQTQNGDGTGNKPGVMLDAINTNTITQNSKIDTTNSHLSTLAGAVSGSEVQVDVVSMPTTTVSDGGGSLTVDNSVLTSLNSAINSNRVDVNIANGGFDGAVTNSALTELAAAINSDRVDVNIANGGFDGAVTNAGLTELAAAINSNKVDVNIASNAVDFATQTTLAAAEAHLGNIETAVQTLDDVVKAEDAAHSGGDKGIMALSVRKDTATFLAGNDGDYAPLLTDANGRLHVLVKKGKSYSSETSYISSQSVSGSGGTHTGSTVTNDANIKEYLFEHNFSGSDVSYEIEESIDNSSFFNALGVSFNDAGSPSASITGLTAIEIKSPFFRVKFTNGNASSRDVNLSFVSISE